MVSFELKPYVLHSEKEIKLVEILALTSFVVNVPMILVISDLYMKILFPVKSAYASIGI